MLRMKSSLAQTQADHRALEQSEKTTRSELQGAQRKAQQYRQENQTLMSNYDRWVHNLVEHASTGEASASAPPPPLRRAAMAVNYSADASSTLSSPVSPESATSSRAGGGGSNETHRRCHLTSSRPSGGSSGSSQ